MRNRIPFGYTPFGGVNLVKLNAKISFEQGNELRKKYPNIIHWNNGQYGMAIEGFVKLGEMHAFIQDMEIMKLDAKVERLLNKKAELLDSFIKMKQEYLNDFDNPLQP